MATRGGGVVAGKVKFARPGSMSLVVVPKTGMKDKETLTQPEQAAFLKAWRAGGEKKLPFYPVLEQDEEQEAEEEEEI